MTAARLAAILLALCLTAASSATRAADIMVLSAGALEAGLPALAGAYGKAHGHTIRVEIATPPAIRRRLVAGARADVLIVPPGVLEDKAIAPRIEQATGRVIGRAGVGIAVHVDAPAPTIDSADAVKAALLAADSVVYNTASTGTYFVKLIERLGIAEPVKAKATIYASGQEVMAHVAKGAQGRGELGIGPITEINLYVGKGVRLVGPLPPEIQNHTSYVAAVMSGGVAPTVAADFIAFLSSPSSRAAFAATGLDVPSR